MSSTAQALQDSPHVTARSERGLRFGGTVRAEIGKVLGQRSTLVLVAIGIVGFAGVMLLLTLGSGLPGLMEKSPARAVGLAQDILFVVFSVGSGIFLLLTSSRLVGMEYSQGTLRILLARGTGRVTLLVAKLLALYAIGLVLLCGFVLASAVWMGLATIHWTGSLAALSAGGTGTAEDLGLGLLLALVSMFSTVVVGSALATVGRSVAFGVGAAMALFPADNFATLILGLLTELTKQRVWIDLSAYLFGPELNALPGLAIRNRAVQTALPPPGVSVTLPHDLVVIGIWALGLLAVELVLTWRRDVLA